MRNIAHCNLTTGECSVTLLDAETNHIELQFVVPDELVELSKAEPVYLYRTDGVPFSSNQNEFGFENLETNVLNVEFETNTGDYEKQEIFYYVSATGYESELILFNIAETLNIDSDKVYIDYVDGKFEIKKTSSVSSEILKAFPIGTIYITPTNSSPASYLGGTWELIDKDFTPLDTSVTFTRSSSSSATLNCSRNGKNIYCRLTFVNSTTLNDTAVTIGKMNISEMGITDLTYGKYQVGQTDGGGAVLMMSINYDGTVTVNDVIDKSNSNTVSSGNTCNVEWNNTISIAHMLDSACNKFYWKRIA